MNVPNPNKLDKKSVSPKRRAIIKGSATAMPVVLTLRSGSAFAAASTTTCNNVRPAVHPNVLVQTSDDWKRVQTVARFVPGIGTSDIVYRDPRSVAERWLAVTENNIAGTPYITKTKADGTTVFIAEADLNNPTAIEYIPTSQEIAVSILVHVTPQGKWTNVVGFDSSGNLPFMTTSCFNSINA